MSERRTQITPEKNLPIARQCRLLGVSRSSHYYRPKRETPTNTELRQQISAAYEQAPMYGVRRMTAHLRRKGYRINRKRIARLYHAMGLQGLIAKRLLSKRNKQHPVYPYLLKDLSVTRINQVWATDITYIPRSKGYLYVMAIIDHYSRFVVGWGISNTMEADFCRSVLEKAIERNGIPDIVNTDQGAQFTSTVFTEALNERGIRISMDSKGRALDNIVIERLWKTLKYEHLYLNEYGSGAELIAGLSDYFDFYNNHRLHQSLGYKTPAEVYQQKTENLLAESTLV